MFVLDRNGRRTTTTSHVRELLELGMSQAEVAATLAISAPTVSYHARKLGIPGDERFRRRYDWTSVQVAYDSGLTVDQCMTRFGFCRATWHKAVQRGAVVPRPRREPLGQVLAAGRPRSRSHVKHRILQAGLKTRRCECCGLDEWLGRPIGLELHHVNGDGEDNRLENLQLLCGNCHAQTPNWGSLNKGKRAA